MNENKTILTGSDIEEALQGEMMPGETVTARLDWLSRRPNESLYRKHRGHLINWAVEHLDGDSSEITRQVREWIDRKCMLLKNSKEGVDEQSEPRHDDRDVNETTETTEKKMAEKLSNADLVQRELKPLIEEGMEIDAKELAEILQKEFEQLQEVKSNTVERYIYKAQKAIEKELGGKPEPEPTPSKKTVKKKKAAKKKAEEKVEDEGPLPELFVTEGCFKFTRDLDQCPVDIESREPLRLTLACFSHLEEVSVDQILEYVWDEEEVTDKAKKRVYDAICRLRGMGLKGLIKSVKGKTGVYVLKADLTVVSEDDMNIPADEQEAGDEEE